MTKLIAAIVFAQLISLAYDGTIADVTAQGAAAQLQHVADAIAQVNAR